MNESQPEWTVARLASYISREGRLDDKQLLSDINTELLVRRERVKRISEFAAEVVNKCKDLNRQLTTEREDKRELLDHLHTANDRLANLKQ